jgi:drug/metabolite transporter (DMT)-like permease
VLKSRVLSTPHKPKERPGSGGKRGTMSAPPARRTASTGVLLVAVAAIGFGSLGVFGKIAYAHHVATSQLLAGRFVLAASLLWTCVFALRRPRVARSHIAAVAGLGVLYAAVTGAYFLALQTIPAALTSLLLFTFPAIVTVVEHVLGDRLTPLRAVAVAAAIVGTAMVIGAPAARLNPVGIGLGLVSAGFYAIYMLVGARVLAHVPSIAGTAVIATSAAAVFTAWALVDRAHAVALDASAVGAIVGLAILCSVIPILAQSAGMPQIGASRAAIVGTLEPVATVVLAALVLGDRFTALQVVGGIVVVASIVVRELAKRPIPQPPIAS